MDVLASIVLILIGVMIGGVVTWIVRGRDQRRLSRTLDQQERLGEEWRIRAEQQGRIAAAESIKAARVDELQQALDKTTAALGEAKAEIAASQATASERAAADARQIEGLTQLRQDMQRDFQVLASQALKANEGWFLKLANETFEKHKVTAVGMWNNERKRLRRCCGRSPRR